MTHRRALFTLLVAGGLLAAAGCGPHYLTPEEVRAHILLPRGHVGEDTIGRVTDDFFKAQRASLAEGTANFIKASESSGDGAAAWAQGVIAGGAMEEAVSMGAAESVADLFCAASLVASIASFDDCSRDADNCEAELIIDSCVLRIGQNGDENARGRIKFHIKTQSNDTLRKTALTLTFEGFEFTEDAVAGLTTYFDGVIAIDATEWGDLGEEVIFTCDLDQQVRGQDRGLFNDDIRARTRLTVAMRFSRGRTKESESGSLEIVAFVDDTEDTRDEAVVLSFAAESRHLDENTTLAGATLQVRGQNGAFSCTWEAASEELEGEVSTYASSGACVDEETGESFTWSSEASYENS